MDAGRRHAGGGGVIRLKRQLMRSSDRNLSWLKLASSDQRPELCPRRTLRSIAAIGGSNRRS